jgi:hypothetical protein
LEGISSDYTLARWLALPLSCVGGRSSSWIYYIRVTTFYS